VHKLLEHIKGMVSHNEELKKMMHETPTIAKRIITKEIVDMIKQKILSDADIRKTINLLMEITFETNVDFKNPQPFLIKHGHYFGISLTLMNTLAKINKDWFVEVGGMLKSIIIMIENSYVNYSSTSNVFLNM